MVNFIIGDTYYRSMTDGHAIKIIREPVVKDYGIRGSNPIFDPFAYLTMARNTKKMAHEAVKLSLNRMSEDIISLQNTISERINCLVGKKDTMNRDEYLFLMSVQRQLSTLL